MVDDILTVPSYPRMSPTEASRRLEQLSGLSLEQIERETIVTTAGASFYPLSTTRVKEEQLVLIRDRVATLAREHGYPLGANRGGFRQFDQQLAGLLVEVTRMLPAEAADEGVWSFLTLNVCPEVAFWRFPNSPMPDGSIRTNYERLVGRPRNIFRRSWWRGYVLGPDLSSRLLEDESVGIMERTAIGGDRRLARVVAATQLKYVDRPGFTKRQDLLRESAKRLRRRMAFVSIYALQEHQLKALVEEVFSEAFLSLDIGEPDPTEVESLAAVGRYRFELKDLWDAVEPELVSATEIEMGELKGQLWAYAESHSTNRQVADSIARSLEILIDEWHGQSAEEQMIVRSAVAYFLKAEDDFPDYYLSGLSDDDAVVTAAYVALGRERSVSGGQG